MGTHVIDDDLNPEWNHTGIISDFAVGETLLFEVYDKDLVRNELLGRYRLKYADFFEQAKTDGFREEVKLKDAGKGVDASLSISVRVGVQSASEPSLAPPA